MSLHRTNDIATARVRTRAHCNISSNTTGAASHVDARRMSPEAPSTSAIADERSIDTLLESIGDESLDAEEDSVVIALRSALGACANDARLSRWLNLIGINDVDFSSASDRKRFEPNTEYINYRQHGVSLCFEAGVLDTVHFYRSGVDGYQKTFASPLPLKLSMSHKGVDIVRALGEPTSKGGAGRMIWLSYDHLGLKFDLASATFDEPDSSITCVAVWNAGD